MNHQLTFRTTTLPRPATKPTPPRIEPTPIATPPNGPRRRWVIGLAAGAAIGAMAIGWSAWSSPDATPDPSSPSVANISAEFGPNADLAPDHNCQRSPLAASCLATAQPAPAIGVSATEQIRGPNADLAPDHNCLRSPLATNCAVNVAPTLGTGLRTAGPNADLAPDHNCLRSPLAATCATTTSGTGPTQP